MRSNEDANAASADRNIQLISELERQSLDRRSASERFSDAVAFHVGRFWFIVMHAVWFGAWVLWNSNFFNAARHFDPFPFPALSTVVALESIFLSLFILMSQNRSNRRAEERSHLDLQVNLLAEHEATKLLQMVRALCAHHNLTEARDPEVAELIRRTDPANLAQELERQLPSEGTTPPADPAE